MRMVQRLLHIQVSPVLSASAWDALCAGPMGEDTSILSIDGLAEDAGLQVLSRAVLRLNC